MSPEQLKSHLEVIKTLEKELNQVSTSNSRKSNKSHLGLANALHASRVVTGPFGHITKERDPKGYAKLELLHNAFLGNINAGVSSISALLEISREWA